MAEWLFVVGLSIEIGGALFVAGEVLFEKPAQRMTRGMTFPSGDPTVEAQRPPAFVWAGAGLIAAGFVVQTVGYIVAAGNAWLLLVASGVIGLTFVLGRFIAERFARKRHRRALADWQQRKQ